MLEINDRVKSIRKYDNNNSIVGKIGTVLDSYLCHSYLCHSYDAVCVDEIHDADGRIRLYTIQFDERINNGHTGYNDVGIHGHCWDIPESCLEPENAFTVELL